jgi:predicted dienelactone hydrolase
VCTVDGVVQFASGRPRHHTEDWQSGVALSSACLTLEAMRVVSVAAPLLVACTFTACLPGAEALPFAPAGVDAAPDPARLGPYPVGVRTVSLIDSLRVDDEGKPRTLPLEVWYPAAESARDQAGETIRLYDALPPDLQADLTADDLGAIPTSAVRDAEARRDNVRFPLVVFSHGKGGIRIQSNFYTVALASHGYVVIAPDHVGDTVVELLREVKNEGTIQVDSTVEAIVYRPEDVMAILDLYGSVIGDDVAAIVDSDHVGVTGHSFGALTSFLVASRDYRVDAVVAQTPTSQEVIDLQSQTPMAELEKPALLQSATLDDTLPEDTNARPLYETLRNHKAWLSLARAGHFTYSDLCVLDVQAISAAVNLDVSNVLDDGCGPGALETERAFPMINATAIGFFNQQLRGSSGSAAFLTQATIDAIAPGEGTFVQTGLAPE